MIKDYFSFFGIKPAFFIDEAALKRVYYQNSRKFHPDHTSNADTPDQADLAEMNNTAYQTLSDFHKRTEYIIKTFGEKEISSLSLDPEFLMEIMEFNEQIDDLKAAGDHRGLDIFKEKINNMLSELEANVSEHMKAFDYAGSDAQVPDAIVEYFLKRKYLLRIQESLNTFADPDSRELDE